MRARGSRPRQRWLELAGAGLALATLAWAIGSVSVGCIVPDRQFEPDCGDYCSKIENSCGGDDSAGYRSPQECMQVCRALNDLDSSENVVALQLNALLDGFEPPGDCPKLGPIGDGSGPSCRLFCSLRSTACPEDAETDDYSKPDTPSCEQRCGVLSRAASSNPAVAADTLECRVGHLTRALTSPADARAECEDSQIAPFGNPARPCEDGDDVPLEQEQAAYCRLVALACTEGNAVYESDAQCATASKVLVRGDMGGADANTLRCRRYHAYLSLSDPGMHCTHAGPTGAGRCALAGADDVCASYCRILRDGCPSAYAELGASAPDNPDAALAECVNQCHGSVEFTMNPTTYSVSEAPSMLNCRTLYAVRALAAPDGPACAAAVIDPTTPCTAD